MRRTLSRIAVAAIIMGMTVIPAAAQDGVIQIAVPDYIPVNGSLDRVVRTGGASDIVPMSSCFEAADYLRAPAVIIDRSQQTAGRFTGVVMSHDIPEGTRITDMVHTLNCVESDGTSYRVYTGTLTSG